MIRSKPRQPAGLGPGNLKKEECMAKLNQVLVTEASRIIKEGQVVAFTGAGVSTESGIPDFRGRGGLWTRYDPMEYGTMGAFRADPEKIWRMLKELYDYLDCPPNPGHQALAELEEKGLLSGIITQNIDGLHQKAGSRKVIEFHGSPGTLTCLSCRKGYEFTQVKNELPPKCSCGDILKPDVVFFDEQIPESVRKGAEDMLAAGRTLLVAGTSCQVIPAAYFPSMFHAKGGKIIEINLEPALANIATVSLQGGFSALMTALIKAVRDNG